MSGALRGRLSSSTRVPDVGETSEELVRLRNVVIEHILSGVLSSPVDYNQSHDNLFWSWKVPRSWKSVTTASTSPAVTGCFYP